MAAPSLNVCTRIEFPNESYIVFEKLNFQVESGKFYKNRNIISHFSNRYMDNVKSYV